jgi:hypothetical protein
MNDREFLLHAFKGDEAAIRLALDVAYVSNIWDDLIDQDKEITKADINTAFSVAMVGIPRNPFYQRWMHELLPVMGLGIANFLVANQFERGDREDRIMAHVMRYSAADLYTHMAALIGGMEWAELVGPELRRRSQRDTLDHYLTELEAKHAVAT